MSAEILEAFMLISFGAAWPASICKSVKSRTARGKSLIFMLIIIFGYLCGIGAKLSMDQLNYLLFFYCLNLVMVATDVGFYFRNRRFDQAAANGQSS